MKHIGAKKDDTNLTPQSYVHTKSDLTTLKLHT